MTIRIGIMGYGNLGRGIACAVKQNPDMELAAVSVSYTHLIEGIKRKSVCVDGKYLDEYYMARVRSVSYTHLHTIINPPCAFISHTFIGKCEIIAYHLMKGINICISCIFV